MGMGIAYVVTRGDDLGGAQIHVRDMATALLRKGERVAVFAGNRGVLAAQLGHLGVPYMEIPELKRRLDPLRDARALRRLRAALRDFGPDLVSTHTAKAGVLGRIAAKSIGVPALFTAHGWVFGEGVPARRRALYRWMERSVSPLVDRVIVVCDSDRKTALRERVTSPAKIRLVYNGMPDIDPDQRARPGSVPVRIVTIARLCEQKDYATLLGALARLQDLGWHLDQIGDGPMRGHIIELARALGLSKRISFLGLRENVAPLLARAQIYLLSSNWEGFPRSILEAMRAGLPVVASDVGGVREAVVDGATGFIVRRSDMRGLADRLRRLIKSASMRAAMGASGRERFERLFTFDRMLDETYSVYREVVDSKATLPVPMTVAVGREAVSGERESV